MSGKDSNLHIKSVDKYAAESINGKSFGNRGTVLLTSTSNYGAGAGVAPNGDYFGFIVGADGATITSITFNDPDLHRTYSTETIADLGLVEGQFYPLEGIKTLTITAGALLLYKA